MYTCSDGVTVFYGAIARAEKHLRFVNKAMQVHFFSAGWVSKDSDEWSKVCNDQFISNL